MNTVSETIASAMHKTPQIPFAGAEPVPLTDSSYAWRIVSLKNRLDAVELGELSTALGELVASGHTRLALDLKNNRFICLSAIYYLVGLAEQLVGKGGSFALISCAEKTKRHFEIYGSLKDIRIVRSESELSGGALRVTRASPDPVQELP